MTVQEAKLLNPSQIIYYKSIFTCPIDVEVDKIKYDINNQLEVHFTDNTFVKEKDLNQLYLSKEECINACIADLEKKMDELKTLLESN